MSKSQIPYLPAWWIENTKFMRSSAPALGHFEMVTEEGQTWLDRARADMWIALLDQSSRRRVQEGCKGLFLSATEAVIDASRADLADHLLGKNVILGGSAREKEIITADLFAIFEKDEKLRRVITLMLETARCIATAPLLGDEAVLHVEAFRTEDGSKHSASLHYFDNMYGKEHYSVSLARALHHIESMKGLDGYSYYSDQYFKLTSLMRIHNAVFRADICR